jgi:hypothetical protein
MARWQIPTFCTSLSTSFFKKQTKKKTTKNENISQLGTALLTGSTSPLGNTRVLFWV